MIKIGHAVECDVCGEEIDSNALIIKETFEYAPTRICEDCLGRLFEDVYVENHGGEKGMVK